MHPATQWLLDVERWDGREGAERVSGVQQMAGRPDGRMAVSAVGAASVTLSFATA